MQASEYLDVLEYEPVPALPGLPAVAQRILHHGFIVIVRTVTGESEKYRNGYRFIGVRQ